MISTNLTKEELQRAMNKCFLLGELHWQQSESDRLTKQDKARGTYLVYTAVVERVIQQFKEKE